MALASGHQAREGRNRVFRRPATVASLYYLPGENPAYKVVLVGWSEKEYARRRA